MPRLAYAGAVFALTAVLLTGCTAGPSARPAIIGGEAPTPAPQQPTGQSPNSKPVPPLDSSRGSELSWQPCGPDVRRNLEEGRVKQADPQCSSITPRLGTETVPSMMNAKISLLKAGNGDTPLLVLNDVDGVPGTVYAAQLASKLPPEVLKRFTLIGMDRRGTGDSDGLGCVPATDRAAILGYDPAQDKMDQLVSAERDAVQECQSDMENSVRTFDTENTLRDIEVLREKLNVPHLSGIGRGEGARLLAQFASKDPKHAGRMVFDGFPDPNAEIQDRTETKAEAAEQTFDAFASSCQSGQCPLGADPRASVTKLLDSLRKKPVTSSDGITIGPGMAVTAMLTGLAERDRWPELATALGAAANGKGDGLADFVRPLLRGDEDQGARFDAGMVTGCNDDDARLPPQQAAESVKEWRKQNPLFGAAFGQRMLHCLPWPPPSNPVGKPSPELPPNLLLSTAHDPVTPAEGTERVAQQVEGTVRVDWQGAGHGALGQSECATKKAASYLTEGKLPSSNTVCPA